MLTYTRSHVDDRSEQRIALVTREFMSDDVVGVLADLDVRSGLARRLCTHAGSFGAPPYEPTSTIRPAIVKYSSGVDRGCPDLAPVMVNSTISVPSYGPPTFPPLARNSSTTLSLNVLRTPGSFCTSAYLGIA
jgi:hypothetical protein